MNELWMLLWIISAVYFAVGLILVIYNLIRLPPNFKDKGLVTTCIITATFCTWLMWVIVYLSQMYPLPGVRPQISWPENYNCTTYDPDMTQEERDACYTPTSLF